MPISTADLLSLREGQPPANPQFLKEMTLGDEIWLQFVREHYLSNYIADGGSKVKILVGGEGTGKTHLLRCVEEDARSLGYDTVFISLRDMGERPSDLSLREMGERPSDLSLREMGKRLSDIVNLYKLFATEIDRERLVRGLCRRVGRELGYSDEQYDGSGPILPLLMERQRLMRSEAQGRLWEAAGEVFEGSDLTPSFRAFAYTLLAEKMAGRTEGKGDICWRWLRGERLTTLERGSSRLYDRLTKANARVCLYSLIRLVRLSGSSGLVLLLDNLEAITERDPKTNQYRYTPNAIKDTCELIRQLIDDAELLEHFLIVMAGRTAILEDERRGLKSYEALWMRLQTGLVPIPGFNRFADIVDVDEHLKAAGGESFAKQVSDRLRDLLRTHGLEFGYREIPAPQTTSPLRSRIMETALMHEGGT